MKRHYIDMPNLKTEEIHAIDLVLENMETVKVYHNEIVEVNLEFEDGLTIGGTCIERKIKTGYIKLKIDENTKRYIGDILIDDEDGNAIKKPYKQKIEGRLLELCNICYIIVTVKEIYWTEQIDVPYEEGEFGEDEYGNTIEKITVCPSAKLDDEGDLIILFGESSEFVPQDLDAKTIEDFAKRWEKYSKDELQAICKVSNIRFCRANTKNELVGKLASYYSNKYKKIHDID